MQSAVKTATILGALLLSFGVSAQTSFDLGTITQSGSLNTAPITTSGEFSYFYNFEVAPNQGIAYYTNSTTTIAGIGTGQTSMALYQGTFVDLSALLPMALSTSSPLPVGAPGTVLAYGAFGTNGPLSTTDAYTLIVTGVNQGSGGFSGEIVLVPAPVPEPETYAMLLAGMGMMGVIAQRRRKRR